MAIGLALIAPVRAHREALSSAINSVAGMRVVCEAASATEAISRLVERRPAVALIDFSAEDVRGLVAGLRTAAPSTQLVAYAVGSSPRQVEAVLHAAASGVSAFVEHDQPIEDIVAAVHQVSRGRPVCGPRIVSLLLQALQRGVSEEASPVVRGAATTAVLTPRERLVAELAARGMTNRQIASELHLGESTVKTHMHAILRKLGLTSRDQLVVVPQTWRAEDPPV